MGAPRRLVLPDPPLGQCSLGSPVDSIFSPSESESGVSSSLSFTDSSSSSFTHTAPYDGESAWKTLTKVYHPTKKDLLAENVARRNELTCQEGNQPWTSYNPKASMRKACGGYAGAFAADCAAVGCCPCALFSLLGFMLVKLPFAMGRKMVTHLRKRRCIKDAHSSCSSRRGEGSLSIFTPTWSRREMVEGGGEEQQVMSIICFDSQNLLQHFKAENVGFGCLSLTREDMASNPSGR